MKTLFIAIFLLGAVAHANQTAKTAPAPKATVAGGETPLSACKNIVELTMKKDFEGLQNWTLWGEKHKGKNSKRGFNKMHDDKMSQLEKLTCNTEVIAQDRAFVEASSEGNKRLIPFVKTETGWKFDAKTYMSFYDFGHRAKMRK